MSITSQNESLSVDDALKRILDAIVPIKETDLIASKKSGSRVLATDHKAQRDIPAFDNSAMDGYLFFTKDLDQSKLKLDHISRLTATSEGVMKSHLLQLYRDSDVYIRLDPATHVEAGESVTVIPYSTTQLP